jgi:hypothetical protein
MEKPMQGYRTLIVAGVMFVAPALARWGFQVDANLIADALIVGAPAAMTVMRAITRTPLGGKAHA